MSTSIEHHTDQYFVSDEIFPADLAIVFGITAWQRPSSRAVELYRQGMARKLLFTGGFNQSIQAIEAVEMANQARNEGVSVDDIIVEPNASHTTANVVNSYRSVEQTIGIGHIDSILLVAIHFHMRRVQAIVKLTFPDRIRLGYASYPSLYYTHNDWFRSERGRADVASEEQKLNAYLAGLQ